MHGAGPHGWQVRRPMLLHAAAHAHASTHTPATHSHTHASMPTHTHPFPALFPPAAAAGGPGGVPERQEGRGGARCGRCALPGPPGLPPRGHTGQAGACLPGGRRQWRGAWGLCLNPVWTLSFCLPPCIQRPAACPAGPCVVRAWGGRARQAGCPLTPPTAITLCCAVPRAAGAGGHLSRAGPRHLEQHHSLLHPRL